MYNKNENVKDESIYKIYTTYMSRIYKMSLLAIFSDYIMDTEFQNLFCSYLIKWKEAE